jgi:hypothetical protein
MNLVGIEFHEAENNRWVKFAPHAVAAIEAERAKDLGAVFDVNVVPGGRPVMYKIDLQSMEQENKRTGFRRQFRRYII